MKQTFWKMRLKIIAFILAVIIAIPAVVSAEFDYETAWRVQRDNGKFLFTGKIAEKAGCPYSVLVVDTDTKVPVDVTQGLSLEGGDFSFTIQDGIFEPGSDRTVKINCASYPKSLNIRIVNKRSDELDELLTQINTCTEEELLSLVSGGSLDTVLPLNTTLYHEMAKQQKDKEIIATLCHEYTEGGFESLEDFKTAFYTAVDVVAVYEINIYVSSAKGNDFDGDGTAKTPFATVGRAQKFVRNKKLNGKNTGNIIIHIAEGIYPELPLVIANEDSLDNGSVTYKGYGDAVLTGAEAVGENAWSQHSGNIYVANVGAGRRIDLVYESGKFLTKARYPDKGINANEDYLKNLGIKNDSGEYVRDVLAFKDGDLPKDIVNTAALEICYWGGGGWMWHNNTSAAAVTYGNYGGNGQQYEDRIFGTGDVKAVAGGIITIESPQSASYRLSPGSLYYLQGAYEFLSEPNEFFYDQDIGNLYWWPEGGDVAGKTLYIPIADNGITIAGRSNASPVKNINLVGLTVEGIKRTGNVVVGGSDSGHGIAVENASGINIKGNRIQLTGGSGIALTGSVNDILVYGNDIHDVGYHGISLKSGKSSVNMISEFPDRIANNIDITNNYVHRGGIVVGHGNGITMDHECAANITATHNKVEDFRRIGIHGYNFMYDDSDYIIAYNEISNVMNGTQDGGVIYYQETTDRVVGPGGVPYVLNNYLHNNTAYKDNGSMIYFDDRSYNAYAAGNLIVHNNDNPFALGKLERLIMAKGDDITIRNNYAYGNNEKFSVHSYAMQDNYDANRLTVENNVFSGGGTPGNEGIYSLPTGADGLFDLQSRILSADNNLFYKEGIDANAITLVAKKATRNFVNWWQASGINKDDVPGNEPAYDVHSVIGVNPQFVDETTGDFRLSKDSPAFALGTKNLDLQSMGLLVDFPFVPSNEDPGRLFVRKIGDTVNPAFYDLVIGESITLETLLRSENGFVMEKDVVTFSSDAPNVAIVGEQTGVIKALEEGVATVTVTVKAGERIKETTLEIYVENNMPISVTGLSFTDGSGNPATLSVGTIFVNGMLNSDIDISVTPIYALYDGENELYTIKADGSINMTAGVSTPLEAQIPVGAKCKRLSLFIWNDLSKLAPLIGRIDFPPQ